MLVLIQLAPGLGKARLHSNAPVTATPMPWAEQSQLTASMNKYCSGPSLSTEEAVVPSPVPCSADCSGGAALQLRALQGVSCSLQLASKLWPLPLYTPLLSGAKDSVC